MTDLIAFIEARLAEDEQWARAASQPYRYAADGATAPADGVHWTWVVGENWTPVTVDPMVDDTVGGPEHYGCRVNLASVEEWRTDASDHGWPVRTMPRVVADEMVEVDSSAAGHIVRHDPARVLREVAAKRRLLAEASAYSPELEHGDNGEWAFDLAVRALASVWSDHPDYRPEWSA